MILLNKYKLIVQILMFSLFWFESGVTFACSPLLDSSLSKTRLPERTTPTLQADANPYIITISPPVVGNTKFCGSGGGKLNLYFNPYGDSPTDGQFVIFEHIEGVLPDYMDEILNQAFKIKSNNIWIRLFSRSDETKKAFDVKLRMIIISENGEYTHPSMNFDLSYSGDPNNNYTRYTKFERNTSLQKNITDIVNEIEIYITENRISKSLFSSRDDIRKYSTVVRDNAISYLTDVDTLSKSLDDYFVRYLEIEGLDLDPSKVDPSYARFKRLVKEYSNTAFGIGLLAVKGKSAYLPGSVRLHWNESAVFNLDSSRTYLDSLEDAKNELLESF